MRNRCTVVWALLCLAVMGSCAQAATEPHYSVITILHTNDLHAHVMPRDDNGGLVRVATLVRQVRADMPNVLLLDAGDIIHGSPEDYFSGGQAIISSMNAAGYQAAAAGNHEFDFGLDTLKAAVAAAKFPVLSANLRAAGGGHWDKIKPYIIVNLDGVRVAIFGLTTMETVSLEWPENIKDIVFQDPIVTAQSLVPELRAKSDVVVALTHLGEDEDQVLAEKVPGIDFIIGGHSHSFIKDWRWVGNTLITQAGCYGQALGRIDFMARIDSNGASIVSVNGRDDDWSKSLGKNYPSSPLVAVDKSVPEDDAVRAAYLPYRTKVDQQLAQVIGSTTAAVPGRTRASDESAAGDLVADAVRSFAKSDVAVVDASSVSQTGLPKGDLTVGSAFDLIGGFTRQQIVTCKISGADLLKALNKEFAGKRGTRYAMSGTSIKCRPGGEPAIGELSVGDHAVDPTKSYSLASQAYVMMSLMNDLPGAFTVVANPGTTTREAIIQYVSEQRTIGPPATGRIARIN